MTTQPIILLKVWYFGCRKALISKATSGKVRQERLTLILLKNNGFKCFCGIKTVACSHSDSTRSGVLDVLGFTKVIGLHRVQGSTSVNKWNYKLNINISNYNIIYISNLMFFFCLIESAMLVKSLWVTEGHYFSIVMDYPTLCIDFDTMLSC